MPDNDWNSMLEAAAGEVLETMFFTEVCSPPDDGGAHPEPGVGAHLRFVGTPSGALTIRVSEPAARGLAANFLAPEDDQTLPAAQLGSVVLELANMICGSLLSRVGSEQHFRLSAPEPVSDGGVPAAAPNQSLNLGEGKIDIWLELENHAA